MVVYELPKEYSNPGCYVRCGLNNLPYVPLDPLVQSPWQKKHKIVPLTFQAPPEKPGEKSGAPAKKKKKKSKKAKKSLDSAAGQSGR
uniref:Uncharacterized protein n=1 Tax=Ciona savignyi TaxID=51511 RepID=H2YHK3_CIOSA